MNSQLVKLKKYISKFILSPLPERTKTVGPRGGFSSPFAFSPPSLFPSKHGHARRIPVPSSSGSRHFLLSQTR